MTNKAPGSANPSQRSGKMTDAKRERLIEIQKREQLKGMLVNKFKLKYGNNQNISKFIDNEVQKFLANDRLTEKNLLGLDAKIGKEANLRDKKNNILDDRQSQRSKSFVQRDDAQSQGLSAANLQALNGNNRNIANGDNQSIRSASAYSRVSGVAKNRDKLSQISQTSSQAQKTEIYSEINENDEWAAIQKFNSLLHFEEQKQAMLRDAERKRLIREQLNKQIVDKNMKCQDENKESKLYDDLAAEHFKLLEEREKQKVQAVKEKIMNDKFSRDLQLQDEKRRKRHEEKVRMQQEQETIQRLKIEMEAERKIQQEKRRQEREYLQKMLLENEKNKQKQKEIQEFERLEDLKSQEQYARMLEKQEQDKLREMKQREARAQEFMNKMADNVLQKIEQRQKFEDDMIARYENEKEMRQRIMEEKRLQRMKQDQENMRQFLAQQVEDKRRREHDEKSNIDQQAKMWQTDKQNYEVEEQRLKDRINKINKDNQDFLLQQMAKKNKGSSKMHPNDFALNKPLLREINQKLKGKSQYEGASNDQQSIRD